MIRIIFGSLFLVFLFLIIRSVVLGRLELRDSLIWFLASILGLGFVAFPELLEISEHFGFQVGSNAIFSGAILFLLGINFLQSLSLAELRRNVRTLVQDRPVVPCKDNDDAMGS